MPKKVEGLASYKIVKISAGGYHTMAVAEDNEIFTFGAGTLGECGYGEFNNIHTP